MAKPPAKKTTSRLATINAVLSLGRLVLEKWPFIAALFGSGIMTYLASLNPNLQAWEWGAIGIAAFAVLCFTIFGSVAAWSWALERRAIARFSDNQSKTALINPLDRIFERKRIKISDFYHPYFIKYDNPSFSECEIFGPGTLALEGNPHFARAGFSNCEIVVVKPGAHVVSAAIFHSPKFADCLFYRVTLLLSAEEARKFVKTVGGAEIIISDGTYGEISGE